MAYIRLADFRSGVDTTRPVYAADPGTLVSCINGHITRGGDIERRLAFDPAFTLPAGTFGLHQIGTKLFVFGSLADPGVPAGVTYQRLEHNVSGRNMVKVLDVESFGGAPYVVAEYDDGAILHYYDGTRVTDWDSIAVDDSSFAALAEYLATKIDLDPAFNASSEDDTVTIIAAVPGTSFTIAATAVNVSGTDDQTATVTQVQANVPAVAETLATGSFDVTGGTLGETGENAITEITVDGADIIDGETITWIDSDEFTAELATQAINSASADTGYSASVAGTVVTITAPTGTGAGENGNVVAVTVSGTVTVGSIADMSGGISEVAAIAQIEEIALGGTLESSDLWTITVDGVDYKARSFSAGMGTSVKTFESKIYAAAGRKLRFCALDNPTDWSTLADGAGFVAFANQDGTSERLIGIEQFIDNLAVFARRAVQIEAVDPDPQLNSLVTTLSNTGAIAARSIINFANTDVFYLSDAGIRSIRPRATTDTAFSSDVGVNIDANVIIALADASASEIENAVSILEPTNSRLLIVIGPRVYVFSYFPGKSIAAWTTYALDFTIEHFAIIGRILYARAGDIIYAYGGTTGTRLPDEGEVTLTVQTPYLPADRDPTHKALRGIDLAAEGKFDVSILLDPNDETISTGSVTIDFITHPSGRVPMEGYSSHFSASLSSDDAGEVTLSNLILHFDPGEET